MTKGINGLRNVETLILHSMNTFKCFVVNYVYYYYYYFRNIHMVNFRITYVFHKAAQPMYVYQIIEYSIT